MTKGKRLLVVVDFQKDFVDGTLGFDSAPALAEPIMGKVRRYQQAGDDVVVTMDTHGEDYLTTQEGKRLPVAHCIKGTPGWEVYGGVKALVADCPMFEKPTFGSGLLFDYLRQHTYQAIELVGLVSNICLISNAVVAKTAQPEAEIIVDSACTASFDPTLHEAALAVLRGLQVTVL